MKTTELTVRHRFHRSDVLPEVKTEHPKLAKVIAWADEHPQVWKIVTGTKSKAFGLGSCVYIGWAQRSMDSEAILERVRHIKELVDDPGRWGYCNSMFAWRAKFTLDHFQDKGFTGGFFQQRDANYPRSCITLDYTPETFDEVLETFCRWMDGYYDTRRITLDGRTVRYIEEGRLAPCLELQR